MGKCYICNHVPTQKMSAEINVMFVVAVEFCLKKKEKKFTLPSLHCFPLISMPVLQKYLVLNLQIFVCISLTAKQAEVFFDLTLHYFTEWVKGWTETLLKLMGNLCPCPQGLDYIRNIPDAYLIVFRVQCATGLLYLQVQIAFYS